MGRDRTSDLLALAERLGNEGGATSTNGGFASGPLPPRPNTSANKVNQSEFAKRVARIGQAIHSTSNKLARLAQLAKRTSLFDDPAQEIQDLTSIVKQDITGLNRAIEDLQQLSAKNRDGSYNKQINAHSTTVVDNLRTRLKDATKTFKDVLTLRTENLKNNQNRRKMFSSSGDSPFAKRGGPLLPRNQLRSNASGPGGSGALQPAGSSSLQPHLEGQ